MLFDLQIKYQRLESWTEEQNILENVSAYVM